MALWRLLIDGEERLAVGPVDQGAQQLLPPEANIDDILSGGDDALTAALDRSTGEAVPGGAVVLAPIGTQEVWASGVTYLRSRDARMEEADEPDHYDRVYVADRPEIFYKASAARTRGPGDPIGIRRDSSWDVPEAELGLVLNRGGRIVGYVVGNDVSSRSIEGENPLYLPQAKSYTGSCAIGPCIVPVDDVAAVRDATIRLEIRRGSELVYSDEVPISEMHRRPEDLAAWLYRALEFPVGVVLLTGTALIPPPEFTLRAGDDVTITIDGIGSLRNTVELVGSEGAR